MLSVETTFYRKFNTTISFETIQFTVNCLRRTWSLMINWLETSYDQLEVQLFYPDFTGSIVLFENFEIASCI